MKSSVLTVVRKVGSVQTTCDLITEMGLADRVVSIVAYPSRGETLSYVTEVILRLPSKIDGLNVKIAFDIGNGCRVKLSDESSYP